MKKTQTKSIEQLENDTGKVTAEDLFLLHREMLASVPRPKFYGDLHIKTAPGAKITLPVSGLPLPDVDLYKGELVKKKKVGERSKRVIAAFRGKTALVIAEGVYNNRKKIIEFVVPENAVSGIATLSFPVWVSMAGARKKTINTIMNSSSTAKACIEKPEQEFPVLVPMIHHIYYIKCSRCLDHSICPNGAIQFTDDGDCYVNQEICLGQTSDIDWAALPNERINQQTCWECIDHPDCPATISKVLRIGNSGACCGCCMERTQRVEGMCLPDWCEYGAIESRGLECLRCPHQELGESTWPYIVDQSLCTGCMLCYDNIVCSKINMKARIHSPVVGVITVNTIRYKEIRVPSSRMLEMSRVRLGVWRMGGKEPRFREIPLEFDSKGHMHIDQEFQLEGEMHMALYRKEKDDTMVLLEGDGAALRPSVKTIPLQQNIEPYSSRVNFNTRYGTFIVSYRANTIHKGF